MEEEPTPPGGFPMRWAITALAIGEAGRTWVEFHDYAWQRQNHRDLAEAQRHLWIRLLDRARAGEVVFRGVKSGTSEISVIGADTMRGSEPAYDADHLVVADATWFSIAVFRTDDLATGPDKIGASRASSAGRKSTCPDEFVQEIVRLALTPDGFSSRQELNEHMKDWCGKHLADPPSDRSVERWTRKYCPKLETE